LGTTLGESQKITAGPESLFGKTLSLNYKACDWMELPISKILLNHKTPTFTVPSKGNISQADLVVLWKKIEIGHLTYGDKPIPRYTKNPNKLQELLELFRRPRHLDLVKEDITSVVVGPNIVGGYDKLAILEEIRAFEAGESTFGKGLKRKEVLKTLDAAISHVTNVRGGVGRVEQSYEPRDEKQAHVTTRQTTMDPSRFLK